MMIPNPDRHITGNWGEDYYLEYEDIDPELLYEERADADSSTD